VLSMRGALGQKATAVSDPHDKECKCLHNGNDIFHVRYDRPVQGLCIQAKRFESCASVRVLFSLKKQMFR
jgi:hypothetical protein